MAVRLRLSFITVFVYMKFPLRRYENKKASLYGYYFSGAPGECPITGMTLGDGRESDLERETVGIHYRMTGCHFVLSRVRILNDVRAPTTFDRTSFVTISLTIRSLDRCSGFQALLNTLRAVRWFARNCGEPFSHVRDRANGWLSAKFFWSTHSHYD